MNSEKGIDAGSMARESQIYLGMRLIGMVSSLVSGLELNAVKVEASSFLEISEAERRRN